jgi:hypothetical protein
MRFTANSWSELGLAPTVGRACEIAVVVIAVSGVASASVISSLVDTAANKSGVQFVVAAGLSGNRTNSTERERTPAASTPLTPVSVLAPVSPPTETAPSEVAAVSSPAAAAPSDVIQNADVRGGHDRRKRDQLGKRSHGIYWSRSARISELARGSISSER